MGVASNGGGYRTTTHPFKLNFQYSSVVQHLPNLRITTSPYKFVPISDIVGGGYDTDYLPDVIGVLTGVGSEREIEKNGGTTRLNVIALEVDGYKIQCTLFGSYCDDLNSFIATGDVHNANCMNCTRLVFNPECEEARALKSRFADDENTPSPMTLTQLTYEDSLFVVLGTIKKILDPDSYSYTSCSCSKVVIPDSQMWFCEKCDKHVMRVTPRFCIKVRVLDNTDCGTMVIFDNDASLLIHKSCQAVLDSIPRGVADGFLPNEIVGLVGQTLLFKVETKAKFNTKFEQSFRDRKICAYANENASLSTLMDKGKTLLLEGSSVGISQDIVCLSSPNLKLKDKVGEHAAVIKEDLMPKFGEAVVSCDEKSPSDFQAKRTSPVNLNDDDMDLPLKLLKRSIKIEKL
ncbi:hypothetical protein TSUD_55640 [Trifolium subterraneum]|uniref:Replication factor A C-terminal domain-containing protein n=1 Tax=Trifolium subterraneum TaxID=3900 RepID=A0A2Z6MY12_TRISU|nr:hypothetical protein TSUD_55640 [Trifolium subterraneum]